MSTRQQPSRTATTLAAIDRDDLTPDDCDDERCIALAPTPEGAVCSCLTAQQLAVLGVTDEQVTAIVASLNGKAPRDIILGGTVEIREGFSAERLAASRKERGLV